MEGTIALLYTTGGANALICQTEDPALLLMLTNDGRWKSLSFWKATVLDIELKTEGNMWFVAGCMGVFWIDLEDYQQVCIAGVY